MLFHFKDKKNTCSTLSLSSLGGPFLESPNNLLGLMRDQLSHLLFCGSWEEGIGARFFFFNPHLGRVTSFSLDFESNLTGAATNEDRSLVDCWCFLFSFSVLYTHYSWLTASLSKIASFLTVVPRMDTPKPGWTPYDVTQRSILNPHSPGIDENRSPFC